TPKPHKLHVNIFELTNMFTIENIEGNSGIGCPVYSCFAQMQNYNFLVLSPNKKIKTTTANELEPLLD
ncbi:MAG: hypothetical protein ACKO96_40530, partial [Flammeovirgaceae bacterium]